MRFLLSVFLFSVSVSNLLFADYYNYHSPGHDSGYLRSGDVKSFKYVIPPGYKAKVYFRSPSKNGTHEVKMRYQHNGVMINTYLIYIFPSNNNRFIPGSCDLETVMYVRLERSVNIDRCHYDLNVEYIPMSNCQNLNSGSSDDGILYLNKSKSKSASRNENIRYYLESSIEGKVEIKLDNLSADLDLYVAKGHVSIPHKKWDCRPYYGGKTSEICTIDLKKSDRLEVVVKGYRAGSFRVTARKNDIKDILVDGSETDYLREKDWDYYKVVNPNNFKKLKARLHHLSGDIDLYIKKGELPTYKNYDCRSWNGGTHSEECKIDTNTNEKIYIGVRGYRSGSYILSLDRIVRTKATVLLHGLASSSETWEGLIKSKFNNHCSVVSNGKIYTQRSPISYNSKDYCFKVNFGAYDRRSGLRNILGKPCFINSGCRGDYSTFDTLGKEVESAVKAILNEVGNDTDITLVGHSRGGLAASAYVGRRGYGSDKVKAVLTTGTPFLGSPLGRINSYMKKYCVDSTQINHKIHCEQDWKARLFLRDAEEAGKGLDIIVPSVKYLEEGSSAFDEIFSEERIRSLQTGKRDYESLVYKGQRLGNLLRFAGLAFNPFPSLIGGLDFPIATKQFSNGAENYILGYSPSTKAQSLQGDGIVPYKNQDIASIYAVESSVQYVHVGQANGHTMLMPQGKMTVETGFDHRNRKLSEYDANVVHIEEPKQVDDISSALDRLWQKQNVDDIHTLLPATQERRRTSGRITPAF